MDEEEMQEPMPMDGAGPPAPMDDDGDRIDPDASEAVRSAVMQLRQAMDDPAFEEAQIAALTGSKDMPRAVAAMLAMLVLGAGDRLGLAPEEMPQVALHLAGDVLEEAEEAGMTGVAGEETVTAIVQQFMQMMGGGGQPAEMTPEPEMDEPPPPDQAPPRRGFGRMMPGG